MKVGAGGTATCAKALDRDAGGHAVHGGGDAIVFQGVLHGVFKGFEGHGRGLLSRSAVGGVKADVLGLGVAQQIA